MSGLFGNIWVIRLNDLQIDDLRQQIQLLMNLRLMLQVDLLHLMASMAG